MEETEQIRFWKGEFGDEYTIRNSEDFDEVYKKCFGVTRTVLNSEFLSMLKKGAAILEVGCNRGAQLNMLQKAGYSNLWAIEINKTALSIARGGIGLNLVYGSAFDIPFKDNFFDLVFTSGVLIHISPDDLGKAIDEMYRTTKKYLWCFEYYSPKCEEILYRGHKNRLWKNDFMKLFLERHPDLKVVKERKIKRLDQDNTDVMFLLEKPAKL